MSARAKQDAAFRHCVSALFCAGLLAIASALCLCDADAALIKTVQGEVLSGDATPEKDQLIIKSAVGATPLNYGQISTADFGLVPFESSYLPPGWHSEEMGQVHGSCITSNNQFTLRVARGRYDKQARNYHAVHFVGRPLRAAGEIQARVERVTGPQRCLAGVMMRQNFESQGAFVFLGVSEAPNLSLLYREAGWKEIKVRDIGPVSLPLSLKLCSTEKSVLCYRSMDGNEWQELDSIPMQPGGEPCPPGSDTWLPKIYVGLAQTGPCTNLLSTAVIHQVHIAAQGLLGAYYADKEFKELRFTRPDDRINYWWGNSTPVSGVSPGQFSVRWIGNLFCKESGTYHFYFDADSQPRLWMNGKELHYITGKEKLNRFEEILLNEGKHEVRIEYLPREPESHVHLKWRNPSGTGEEVPRDQLSYHYLGEPAELAEPGMNGNSPALKGTWLRNGSFIPGELKDGDDQVTRIALGMNELVIDNSKLACIVLSKDLQPGTIAGTSGRRGLLYSNGDFFECDYNGVHEHALNVTSVLFGRRTVRFETAEAAAFIFNEARPAPAAYQVVLMDGARLSVEKLQGSGKSLLLKETILGEMKIPFQEVRVIRKKS